MPNWRKHSDSKARLGSLKPTKATRAEFLRGKEIGAEVTAKALSIECRFNFRESLWGCAGGLDNTPKGSLVFIGGARKDITPKAAWNEGFGGALSERAQACVRRRENQSPQPLRRAQGRLCRA